MISIYIVTSIYEGTVRIIENQIGNPSSKAGCPNRVVVKTMDCRIIVREFEFQLCYYIHFWTNTLGKGMNPLILPAMD